MSRDASATRVATRWVQAAYFSTDDIVLYGKYKNHRGKIVKFDKDKWGNPTIEIEPIPKGRKKNKVMGLFKVWRADVKEKALAELEKKKTAQFNPLPVKQAMDIHKRIVARFVKAEGIPLGRSWETGTILIHRYRGSFQITDLTNAGKRGKKVRQMSVGLRSLNDNDPWYDNMAKMLAHVQSYDEALRLFKDLEGDFPGQINRHETELRGIDVNPGGTTKIHLTTNTGLQITADPLDFSVKSTVTMRGPKGNEFNQDTLYTPVSRKDAAPFYNWLKANLSEANKMGIAEMIVLWRSLGIRYDYH